MGALFRGYFEEKPSSSGSSLPDASSSHEVVWSELQTNTAMSHPLYRGSGLDHLKTV